MNNCTKIEDPNFTEFIYELCERKDDFTKRPIIISPYFGSLSKLAGFVIAVHGTPPKATIYIPLDSYKAIVNTNQVKVIYYNKDYIRLIGFLKRHEIDKIYKTELC